MSCTTILHSFFIRVICRVICIYLRHMWNRWNMAAGRSGVRVNVCVCERGTVNVGMRVRGHLVVGEGV